MSTRLKWHRVTPHDSRLAGWILAAMATVLLLVLLPGCSTDDSPTGIGEGFIDPPAVEPGVHTLLLDEWDDPYWYVLGPDGGALVQGANVRTDEEFLIRMFDDATVRYANRYAADLSIAVPDRLGAAVVTLSYSDSSGHELSRELKYLDGAGRVRLTVPETAAPLTLLGDGSLLLIDHEHQVLHRRHASGELWASWQLGVPFGRLMSWFVEDGDQVVLQGLEEVSWEIESWYDFTVVQVDVDAQQGRYRNPSWRSGTLSTGFITPANDGYLALTLKANWDDNHNLIVVRADDGMQEIERATIVSGSDVIFPDAIRALSDGGAIVLATAAGGWYGGENTRHPMLIRLNADLTERWRHTYLSDWDDYSKWYLPMDVRVNQDGFTVLVVDNVNVDRITLIHTDLNGNTQ